MKPAYVENVRAEYKKVAEAHEKAEAAKKRTSLAAARANAHRIDWSATRRPSPPSRARKCSRMGSGGTCPLYRLDALLPDLGAEGPLSGYPRGRKAGRGRPPALRRRASHAEEDHRREVVRPARRHRLLAGQRRRRRHPPLHRREPQLRARQALHAPPAARQTRGQGECRALRLRRPPPTAASKTISAASSSPPASRKWRLPNASSAPMTTTSSIMVKALADASPSLRRTHARKGPKGILGLRHRRDLRTARPSQ